MSGRRDQSDVPASQDLRRQHRVEDPLGLELIGAEQQAQVVIGAVQDQIARLQQPHQPRQVQRRQRINDPLALAHAKLDQADFFTVMVEAVGLGIHGDGFVPRDLVQQETQFFLAFNQDKFLTHACIPIIAEPASAPPLDFNHSNFY